MNDLLQQFGRRLRIGMVGGGQDSVIGRTHLSAMRVDGFYDLVAGAMSIDPEVALTSGRAELIAEDRIYTDFHDMALHEGAREDGIDVVVVATPPQLHYQVANQFLQQGIDVICEKPICRDLDEALSLKFLVEKHQRLLCLTHCYTGYPMVRQARAMVSSGALGEIRIVEAELCAGDLRPAIGPEDPAGRHWRFRAASMGQAAILGEVASHAYNLITFVTGIELESVSAEMKTFVPGREVYDNAFLTGRFEAGVSGRIWGSYVAAGNDHGLSFRIFGEDAGLTWIQEDPEYLWFKRIGEPAVRLARGYDSLSLAAQDSTRLRPGHPEGYILAFANLYSDFAKAVIAKRLGMPHEIYSSRLPGVADGVSVMAMIDAASRSNDQDGAWTNVPREA